MKKQLLDSMDINNASEIEELNKRAERVEKPEDAADIIREYEEILRAKKKGIIVVAFYQGKIFKRFKEKQKFQEMVGKLKFTRAELYSKSTFSS